MTKTSADRKSGWSAALGQFSPTHSPKFPDKIPSSVRPTRCIQHPRIALHYSVSRLRAHFSNSARVGTGTARGQGTASGPLCCPVQPSKRVRSHSATPSPGNGRILSTSCDMMRPVSGEKVYSEEVFHVVSCRSKHLTPSNSLTTHRVRCEPHIPSNAHLHAYLLLTSRRAAVQECGVLNDVGRKSHPFQTGVQIGVQGCTMSLYTIATRVSTLQSILRQSESHSVCRKTRYTQRQRCREAQNDIAAEDLGWEHLGRCRLWVEEPGQRVL